MPVPSFDDPSTGYPSATRDPALDVETAPYPVVALPGLGEAEVELLDLRDRRRAALVHLSAFVGGPLGPVLFHVLCRAPFVRGHARAAMLFHASLAVQLGAIATLGFTLSGWNSAGLLSDVGLVTLAGTVPAAVAMHGIAAWAAARGRTYRYPGTLRIFG